MTPRQRGLSLDPSGECSLCRLHAAPVARSVVTVKGAVRRVCVECARAVLELVEEHRRKRAAAASGEDPRGAPKPGGAVPAKGNPVEGLVCLWRQDDAVPHEDTLDRACRALLGWAWVVVRGRAVASDDRGEVVYYFLPDGVVVSDGLKGEPAIYAPRGFKPRG